jgi:hypothetical protein
MPELTTTVLVPLLEFNRELCPWGEQAHLATHAQVTRGPGLELRGVTCELHRPAADRDLAKALRAVAARPTCRSVIPAKGTCGRPARGRIAGAQPVCGVHLRAEVARGGECWDL